jgi:hypothetical protein
LISPSIYFTTKSLKSHDHPRNLNLDPCQSSLFHPGSDRRGQEEKSGLLYTPDWLAGIAYRETGGLINKYGNVGTKPEIMHTIMRGDFSKRTGEKEASFHGYGYWQIDIGSFPEFVKSGDWKDPLKCCIKAIDVLESKGFIWKANCQSWAEKIYSVRSLQHIIAEKEMSRFFSLARMSIPGPPVITTALKYGSADRFINRLLLNSVTKEGFHTPTEDHSSLNSHVNGRRFYAGLFFL